MLATCYQHASNMLIMLAKHSNHASLTYSLLLKLKLLKLKLLKLLKQIFKTIKT